MSGVQTEAHEAVGITTMVSRILKGFHCTVFAYGQTGSGGPAVCVHSSLLRPTTSRGHKSNHMSRQEDRIHIRVFTLLSGECGNLPCPCERVVCVSHPTLSGRGPLGGHPR
eukprot:4433849-Pyramimonas_sp.AAC.1